tara:strand:- start:332 stop:850 length:519 start_codon:yes stop_codon:yes gene_type:complete
MSELSSKFTRDDLETLIDSIGDWEQLGNQEWHLLNMIKNAPMPPEDHEAFEHMQGIKNHFRSREREIEDSRQTRQEKAVFLKAKLMLVRRDMGIDQLFEMAAEASSPQEPAPVEKVPVPVSTERSDSEGVKIPVKDSGNEAQGSLELAEFFIRDLGVWDHYQKFLAEKQDVG